MWAILWGSLQVSRIGAMLWDDLDSDVGYALGQLAVGK